jgi:hypothetical protein
LSGAGRSKADLEGGPGSELVAFLVAVMVGSVGGLIAGRLLASAMPGAAEGTSALAVGTTLTGAAHARLVHGRSIPSLAPRVVVAAPLAYLVMHGVHRLLQP